MERQSASRTSASERAGRPHPSRHCTDDVGDRGGIVIEEPFGELVGRQSDESVLVGFGPGGDFSTEAAVIRDHDVGGVEDRRSDNVSVLLVDD